MLRFVTMAWVAGFVTAAVALAGHVDGFTAGSMLFGGTPNKICRELFMSPSAQDVRSRYMSRATATELRVTMQPEQTKEEDLREKLANKNEDLSEVQHCRAELF